MADIKDRAREYLAKNSEYNEVYGEFFVAVDTMTAMIEFAEQETKELEAQIEKMKCCSNCKFGYKCSLFSTQIHKENGVEYQTQAKWNKEKEKYCNVGYSGKYECWEIKEK